MAETKECKCGGLMYHNEGISKKTGKPYANWKCKICGELEWLSVAGSGQQDKLGAIREMLIVIDEKLNKLLAKYEEK